MGDARRRRVIMTAPELARAAAVVEPFEALCINRVFDEMCVLHSGWELTLLLSGYPGPPLFLSPVPFDVFVNARHVSTGSVTSYRYTPTPISTADPRERREWLAVVVEKAIWEARTSIDKEYPDLLAQTMGQYSPDGVELKSIDQLAPARPRLTLPRADAMEEMKKMLNRQADAPGLQMGLGMGMRAARDRTQITLDEMVEKAVLEARAKEEAIREAALEARNQAMREAAVSVGRIAGSAVSAGSIMGSEIFSAPADLVRDNAMREALQKIAAMMERAGFIGPPVLAKPVALPAPAAEPQPDLARPVKRKIFAIEDD
jgi:hypothetical protein